MQQRQLPLLAVILALLLGIRIPFSGKQPVTTGSKEETSSQSSPRPPASPPAKTGSQPKITAEPKETELTRIKKRLCELGGEELYGDLFNSAAGAPAKSNKGAKSSGKGATNLQAEASSPAGEGAFPACVKNLKITSLIASVPDPIHTHLGLVFDRTLDAIQAAAASKGYLLQRSERPKISPLKDADASVLAEEKTEIESPGILVFRKKDATAEYLLVFLVPESPTAGINWSIFSQARKLIVCMANTRCPSNPEKPGEPFLENVWFAGPLYSGSVAGFERVNSGLSPQKCIHAISATVTNPQSSPSGNCPPRFLQTSDREAIESLVCQSQYRPSQVALLSEEATEYGNLEDNLTSIKCGDGITPDSDKKTDESNILFLHFPREISRLRNAYGSDTGQPGVSSGRLSLNWRDPAPERGDKLPAFGGLQTALSQETVLASLATTVKSRGIKLLGILATDPWDVAFLVRSFKDSCPNVRLFVREADLLYLRASNLGLLNGVLVVNNYPLVPQNQFWTSKSGERRFITFPSGAQEAQYNALTVLLTEQENEAQPPQVERKPATRKMQALEGGWPLLQSTWGDPTRPDKPLWLATTGTTGYYPLKILNESVWNESELKPTGFRSLYIGRPPFAAILVWVAFALVGVLHTFALLSRSAVPSAFREEFDKSEHGGLVAIPKAFLHVAGLAIIATGCFVSGSSFFYFWNSSYKARLWFFSVPVFKTVGLAAILLTLGLLAVAAAVLWNRVLTPQFGVINSAADNDDEERRPPRGSVRAAMAVCLVVAFLAAPATLWSFVVFPENFENTFLHYRDLYLASGVAPALPVLLMLAIIYFGLWVYLRRFAFRDYGKVELPFVEDGTGTGPDFQSHANAIDLWMTKFPDAKYTLVFFVIFAGILFPFRPWTTLDSLEVNPVNGVIFYCYVFSVFFLLVNWFRFFGIWRELRKILHGLEVLPLRAAFNRLPKQSSSPIWGWQVTQDEFLPVTEALDNLHGLVRENAVHGAALHPLKAAIRAYRALDKSWKATESRQEEKTNVVATLEASQTKAVSAPLTGTSGPVLIAFSATRRTKESATTMTFAVASSEQKPEEAPIPCSRERKRLLQDVRREMDKVISELLTYLEEYWRRGASETTPAQANAEKVKDGQFRFILAENLVALRFYNYIRYVVTEMRRILFFSVIAASVLFMALHTYAFRADRSIDLSFLFLFLFLGTIVIWVLAQMERDPLLGRLQGTDARSLGKNFYLDVARYGIVPLLTIVSSQIPWVSNMLLGWFQPTLDVLR